MKIVRLVLSSLLLMGSFLAILPPSHVLAQEGSSDNTTEEEEEFQFKESLILAPIYPKMEAIAGGDFVFEIEAKYFGMEDRNFDLRVTPPPGWDVYMTPQYEKDKKISAIRLQPVYSAAALGTKFLLTATAPFYPLPDPGEYKITLDATSGDLKTSTVLTAVVTAKYMLAVIPTSERYNTTATVGKENVFSLDVGNLGTAAIENITFSPTKPEGWLVEFKPDKIEKLEAFSDQTVDVTIKPPAETIAGDYILSIRASGKQTSANNVDIRVTVESPTIWGWVGVGIILLVVAGLVVIFMRFSRR